MEMRSYRFEGIVTALSSISHIGESHGINARFRREKLVLSDGTVELVPVISGNGVRGVLRRRGMWYMLRQLGYGPESEARKLSLAAQYFLFSGGSLTSMGDRGLDIDYARRLRDLVPLVSIFGGAVGNQIMPGKVSIGKMMPICQETAHLLPEAHRNGFDGSLQSIWEFLQEEPYTRRDTEKDETLRLLIEPEQRLLLEAEAKRKREKRGTDRDVAGKTGQKQQMRYFVETLAAGTRFSWRITLHNVTDLEFDAFMTALAEFSRSPTIGGKAGVGHGLISVKFDRWFEINPRLTVGEMAVDVPLGQRYVEHLKQNANAIRELLGSIR